MLKVNNCRQIFKAKCPYHVKNYDADLHETSQLIKGETSWS